MKKIFLAGRTGFIGKNLFQVLEKKYEVLAPTRQELNLKDTEAVLKFVDAHKIDMIVSAANPNCEESLMYDSPERIFEDSLRIFMNLYKASEQCEKMIYLGSGAEYDKRFDICNISEEEVARSLPIDGYGYAKYIMNELAKSSKNIYNLRVFACYGPYDHASKFITHVVRCCLANENVTIRQDCYFDYLHVSDLARVICKVMERDMKYHDYNVASGKKISLKEIAEEVCRKMGNDKEILIKKDGFNKEYTASIKRLESELHMQHTFLSIDEGIDLQIEHEENQYKRGV